MPVDDMAKVSAALEQAGAAGLTQTEIYADVFNRNRDSLTLRALLYEMSGLGLVESVKEPSNGDRPTLRWMAKANEYRGVTDDPVPATTVAVAADGPPPGDGWVEKKALLRQAERGVMPAHAIRVGRRLRKKWRAQKKVTKPGTERVTEESLGRSYLVGGVYRGYRRTGVIEEQGTWVRLAKNPPTRPRHAWSSYILELLAEAHPTLDGRWRRKPKKTLVGVAEDALGRRLEPHERVRRWPGYAGSWDPRYILLFDSEEKTITTLAEIRKLT